MEELIKNLETAEPCTSETRRDQLRVIRSLAERARQNPTIRRKFARMLDWVKDQSAAEVFRAYYPGGAGKAIGPRPSKPLFRGQADSFQAAPAGV